MHMKIANRAFIESTLDAFKAAAQVVLVERLDVGVNAERFAVYAHERKVAV